MPLRQRTCCASRRERIPASIYRPIDCQLAYTGNIIAHFCNKLFICADFVINPSIIRRAFRLYILIVNFTYYAKYLHDDCNFKCVLCRIIY